MQGLESPQQMLNSSSRHSTHVRALSCLGRPAPPRVLRSVGVGDTDVRWVHRRPPPGCAKRSFLYLPGAGAAQTGDWARWPSHTSAPGAFRARRPVCPGLCHPGRAVPASVLPHAGLAVIQGGGLTQALCLLPLLLGSVTWGSAAASRRPGREGLCGPGQATAPCEPASASFPAEGPRRV